MANRLQSMLQDLRSRQSKSEEEEALLSLLEKKQAELGDDITEAEAVAAVLECLKERHKNRQGEEDEYMKTTCETVTAFFDAQEWHYKEVLSNSDTVVYELGFSLEGISFKMRVYVEDDPKVCRIDAILPLAADPIYAYILCLKMAEENYPRRYGALQYDKRDGEVSYRYSFPIGHGLYPDDLERTFLAVAASAAEGFKEVQKICVGKFKKKEVDEIIERLTALITDLTDEDE